MIKISKHILIAVIALASVSASAQTTTNSPYSQRGLGDLKGLLLPQNLGMGGISMGVRKPGPYYNINPANPASYSALQLTTFDIGATTDIRQLSKVGTSENSFNASLNHITFAVPVNAKSALSIGLLPFSEMGYQFKVASQIDTNKTNFIYDGDGGLSKAYVGYGFSVLKNLSIGANLGYVFGNLKENRSAVFPDQPAALNSRIQDSRSVEGFSYDYALQYTAKLTDATKLVIGYSGNAGGKLNSKNSIVSTHFRLDAMGNESPALDTVFNAEGTRQNLKLPLTHTVGFAFEGTNKWLVGMDVSYAKWSDFKVGNVNGGLSNTYGVALGGQFTPDATSVSDYFKLVDYRLGFRYDKTYVKIGNNDVNQYALTMGLGLPLPSNRSSFYKINLAAELGQRGTLANRLVRERYVNLTLGFLLNDRWFIKSKFD